ncbi:MAG: glycoside hydrolase [Actinomycetota bacterium]|nr:glycoside hydrolase [Actinomycetota bacterium]
MSFLRRPVVLMVLGALLLGTAGIVFSTRDANQTVAADDPCGFPPCRAAADPEPARGYEGAFVAADPADPDHVVVTDANLLEGRCGFHTTFNRGREWTDGWFDLPPGYTGCRINGGSGGHVANGSVHLGSANRVYAVFGSAHADSERREDVLVATSSDGGRTFAPAKVAIRRTGPDVGLGRPLMTVVPGQAGRDTILLSAWACGRDEARGGGVCITALFSRSDDGGETYSDPVVANGPPAGQNPSQPAMDADGVVYLTYQVRFSDGPVELYLAKSTDGGRTFSHSLIDRQVQIGLQHDPAKLVADRRTGALYTVWADTRVGRSQIFFRKSPDKGLSWGDRSTLIAPDPSYTGSSRSPAISLAPNGRIDVVYYHTGPSAEAQKFDNVYWSYSVNGGDNFLSRQVNDEPVDRSKGYSGTATEMRQLGNWYPPGISSVDDAAYVVWSDTRLADELTNSQDVLLRRMELVGDGALPP